MSASNQPGKIACPHCQAMIKAPALAAGSTVNCPKCGQGFRLGETDQSPKSKVQGPKSADRSPESGVRSQKGEVGSPQRAVPQPPPAPKAAGGPENSVPSTENASPQ